MGIVILYCIFHILFSFVLEFCCDYVYIDSRVSVKMPSLNNLGERFGSQEMYNLQRYVDQAILPSSEYFQKVSDIDDFQSGVGGAHFYANLSTFCLVNFSFFKLDLPKYITIPLGFIVPILISVTIHLIYKKSSFRIKTFEYSAQDLKNLFESQGYFYYFDIYLFDISESMQFNNFVINIHNRYINQIYTDIKQRRAVRHVALGIATMVLIYASYRFK